MSETIKAWNAFELLALPLRGARPVKGLKRGQAVSAGERLGLQADPARGDVHASTSGWVEEINEIEIIIRRDEEAVGSPPEPHSLHGRPSPDLARALKELGLDRPKILPGDTLIISTLNPEPGLALAPALFGEHKETIQAGLEAALRLWPGHRLQWAVTRLDELPPEAEGQSINVKYPFSLPSLIKKRMTGLNDPGASGVLGGRELFLMGRLWRTGLPLTISPITLGSSNYFIPLGARIVDLLTFANLMPGPGEAVIKGGLVRGCSLSRLERGLDQSAAALHLERGAGATSYDPCRECGECTRACPAGLPIGRLAGGDPGDWPARLKWKVGGDKKPFPDANRRPYHSLAALGPIRGPELDACLVCGACALACPSGRPLLSLARLAKAAIEAEWPRQ